MKKGLKRFFSMFLAIVMFVSIMPAFELDAFAASTIQFNEYSSTGSRKIAGQSTGGIFKLTPIDNSGTKGKADFSNCFLRTVPETNGVYKFKMYSNKKCITFYNEDAAVEFYANVVYENGHQGEFKYITKIDSLSIPIGRQSINQFETKTYFKRGSAIKQNDTVASNAQANLKKILSLFKSNEKPKSIKVTANSYTAINNILGVSIGGVAAGATLDIIDVSGNKGKVIYNGQEAWVDLYYCNYVEPSITKPLAPSITLNSSQDIPVGGYIEVSWNDVTDAEYYTAELYDENEKCVKTVNNIYTNNTFFETTKVGTYTVKLYAQNYMYKGDVAALSKK